MWLFRLGGWIFGIVGIVMLFFGLRDFGVLYERYFMTETTKGVVIDIEDFYFKNGNRSYSELTIEFENRNGIKSQFTISSMKYYGSGFCSITRGEIGDEKYVTYFPNKNWVFFENSRKKFVTDQLSDCYYSSVLSIDQFIFVFIGTIFSIIGYVFRKVGKPLTPEQEARSNELMKKYFMKKSGAQTDEEFKAELNKIADEERKRALKDRFKID